MNSTLTKLELILLIVVATMLVIHFTYFKPQYDTLRAEVEQIKTQELKIQNMVKTRLDERTDMKIAMQRLIRQKNDSISLILQKFLDVDELYKMSRTEVAGLRRTVMRLKYERDSLQRVSNTLDSALISLNKLYVLRENEIETLKDENRRLSQMVTPEGGGSEDALVSRSGGTTPSKAPVREMPNVSRYEKIDLENIDVRVNSSKADRLDKVKLNFTIAPVETFREGSVYIYLVQRHNESEGPYRRKGGSDLRLLDGSTVPYVLRKKVYYTDAFDFNNTPNPLEVSYEIDEQLKPGIHFFEFYLGNSDGAEGRPVATRAINLK